MQVGGKNTSIHTIGNKEVNEYGFDTKTKTEGEGIPG